MIWHNLTRHLSQTKHRVPYVKRLATMAEKNVPDNKAAFHGPNFDNLLLRTLPVDASKEPGSRQVSGACFSLVSPTPVNSPKVVAVSKEALSLLDIDDDFIGNDNFSHYFSGNKVMDGSETAAHCYCGHQFGYFSGQLGDGAAIYLGEVVNRKNERWELQLKGAGLTPYSRTADGRKVLRSSIREFLCSEAMHHLGIPTTRAGSCITSDSRVVRDIFYDGNPKNERCTIVSRIAETFLRFGSFEIFKPTDEQTGRSGPSVGRDDILKKMLDYVLSMFYPEVKEKYPDESVAFVEMYREICHRTAALAAKWQCVGFCHGVLNTDNMSIVGLTIDYGPFGFMERYNPEYICNGSDDGGRYSYKNQPDICEWNLKKLAEAWQKVVPLEKTEEVVENDYKKVYLREYSTTMRKKLGLLQHELEDDSVLVKDLMSTMEETNADFTNTFRALSAMCLPGMNEFDSSKAEVLQKILQACFNLEELKTTYKPRMDQNQLQSIIALVRQNPMFLNMLGGGKMGMIMAELDNLGKLDSLKNTTAEDLQKQYMDKWNKWLDAYGKRLEKEVENAQDLRQLNSQRVKVMNATNPAFILRNHIAQNAIDEAENNNFKEVQRVLEMLKNPFDKYDVATQVNEETEACSSGQAACAHNPQYSAVKTPLWALQLKVT